MGGYDTARSTVHVIGAGMAGLSAATAAAEQGQCVHLYESSKYAGGRCRSFYDKTIDRVIDNGNHLMLNGNVSMNRYTKRIGGLGHLKIQPRAAFPFMDMMTGARWTLDLGCAEGFWRSFGEILIRGHGIPGCRSWALITALRLRQANQESTILQQLGNTGTIYQRLWEPLSIAILNTEPDRAMAASLWPVFKEILGQGANACRPVLAKEGLSSALVKPALDYLKQKNAIIRFSAPLRALKIDHSHVCSLNFPSWDVEVKKNDRVILALPASHVSKIVRAIKTPNSFRSIINAHFKISSKKNELTIIGLINSNAHWIFQRGDVASVTVSAASDLVDAANSDIASLLWQDVMVALSLKKTPIGAYRIVKERRATFTQSPEQNLRRPIPQTPYSNLSVAGDWTDTGLPASIEGAIRSGEQAVRGRR